MTGTYVVDGVTYRAGKRVWTVAEDLALRESYPDAPTAVVAEILQRGLSAVYIRARKLGLEKSAAYLASPDACRLRRGDNVGAPFRFPKGHVPANKGLRRPGWSAGRMKTTQFQKGAVPHTWMPVGSTRLVDGYLYRKVSDIRNVPWTRNWRPEHVLLWEKAHRRRLKPGECLVFKDRNRLNVGLENLERITRRALMARNTVHNLPKPLKQAVQLLGALNRQIRRRTKHAAQH